MFEDETCWAAIGFLGWAVLYASDRSFESRFGLSTDDSIGDQTVGPTGDELAFEQVVDREVQKHDFSSLFIIGLYFMAMALIWSRVRALAPAGADPRNRRRSWATRTVSR